MLYHKVDIWNRDERINLILFGAVLFDSLIMPGALAYPDQWDGHPESTAKAAGKTCNCMFCGKIDEAFQR